MEIGFIIATCARSFVKDGKLFIKPTLTSDRFGEKFLHSGKYNLKKEGCNIAFGAGCILYVLGLHTYLFAKTDKIV